jgi:hypothetical protein
MNDREEVLATPLHNENTRGGYTMFGRFISRTARVLLLSALLIVPILTASAQSGRGNDDAPGVPDAWTLGPNTTFSGTTGAWERFDGEYYPGNGRVYFLGGRDGTVTMGDIYYFDSTAGAFTDTGVDMPVPVGNYTIALLQDATGWGLYIFGGRTSTGVYTQAVQAYYPATNTVVNYESTDPWNGRTASSCLAFPGGVAVYNNKAYVFGGFATAASGCVQDEASDQTWIFDPMAAAGAKWTNTNEPLSGVRAYIPSAVADGMIYAIGGDDLSTGALTAVAIVERLNPANIAAGWDDAGVADLPLPSSGLPGCDESQAFGFDTGSPFSEVAGKIVLAGCGQFPDQLTDSFIYTISSNSWATWEPLNEARRNHAGALIPASQGTGTPGMWVFGGIGAAGDLVSTEYRTLTTASPQFFLYLPLVVRSP